MKIALIGNQNNNFFALLRYFKELNLDVTLFLFSNEANHFLPEKDTHNIKKWEPYIKQLNFQNSTRSLLFTPKKLIKSTFKDYDICIGTGIVPALFQKAKLKLDIFIPYATAFEYIDDKASLKKGNSIHATILGQIVYLYQKYGIKNTRSIIMPSFEKRTQKIIEKFKLNNVTCWWFPMVYIEPPPAKKNLLFEKYSKNSDCIFFSHTRQWWKHPYGKKNDLPIKAFAKFLKITKFKKPILFLMEYGKDVIHTKKLISDLNIEKHIIWLPQMYRKDIMPLLDNVDLGFAEFHTGLWGGVTWEFLASGVPNINKISSSAKDIIAKHDTTLPPIINASTEEEILSIFIDYEKDPQKYKDIGTDSKEWFNNNQGAFLAKRYADHVKELYRKKNS